MVTPSSPHLPAEESLIGEAGGAAATIEAAEDLAANSSGGRLQTPLLGLLDEAANLSRWTDLPDL